MRIPTGEADDADANLNRSIWEEQQRRQRSIRMLMFVLMFLILMDGEEPHNRKKALRGKKKVKKSSYINQTLWNRRRNLDTLLFETQKSHDRWQHLIELNNGKDEESEIMQWAAESIFKDELEQHEKMKEKQKGFLKKNKNKEHEKNAKEAKDTFENFQNEERVVHHYPRNITGSYRGKWIRNQTEEPIAFTIPNINVHAQVNTTDIPTKVLSDQELSKLLPPNHIGLHLLPANTRLDEIIHRGKINKVQNTTSKVEETSTKSEKEVKVDHPLELNQDEGSVIIRLHTRSIPGLSQVSLVDGIITLYDVNDKSFTSPLKHILLRVRGVILHSLGKISLVANDSPLQSAFMIKNSAKFDIRRLKDVDIDGAKKGDIPIEKVRDDLFSIHDESTNTERDNAITDSNYTWNFQASSSLPFHIGESPFLIDDKDASLNTIPKSVKHVTPDLLMENGKSCAFEVNLNVTDTEITVGDWRTMAKKTLRRIKGEDPLNQYLDEDMKSKKQTEKREVKAIPTPSKNRLGDETLAMHVVGSIISPTCNFAITVNATAVRTDWEQTSAKAINYCFFMMMICMAQTVFLLRQLIHSQAPSAAVKVSILSVAWQTILDAILCIEHILFCMLLSPVSTAFAMVAFLKLLIFCVIEMKYMVLIMQAHYTTIGENLSTEELRKKVTQLHIRFYSALVCIIFTLWHFKDKHRTLCILISYGFWIPQIIHNMLTETKKPLHKNYIYGMSATRLFAPLYTLAMPGNFLLQIEPEFPVDYFTCQMLILWMAFQVSILVGQMKYGARFMIPSLFLPPKYDYNRKIPDHMRPKNSPVKDEIKKEDEPETLLENDIIKEKGPRKRKEKRINDNSITTINHTETCQRPTLDCVICYNDIDIGDRMRYMLAPCNHIFHKQCLEQWMEVKMECPVCRTNLPAL